MGTIVVGLRVLLAAVFVTAGVGKLLDLRGSRRAMADFGVPERAARIAGTALPVIALAALLLLVAFIIGIARALARGEEPDCHCFGQIHSAPAGRLTLVRNGVLAACAAVIVVYGSGPAVDAWVNARSAAELAAVAAVIVALASVTYASRFRADVQRLTRDLDTARQAAALGRPGLPVGVDAPPFTLRDLNGETITLTSLRERGQPILLIFMTPWCAPCATLLPKVQQWQQTLSERLTIVLMSTGTVEENGAAEELSLTDVLLQEGLVVSENYRIKGTPSAVFVTAEGKIASNPGEAEAGIEPLVRLALRDGVGASMEGSVA
jgi:thiol-disulfide isomerase/thioredoxin